MNKNKSMFLVVALLLALASFVRGEEWNELHFKGVSNVELPQLKLPYEVFDISKNDFTIEVLFMARSEWTTSFYDKLYIAVFRDSGSHNFLRLGVIMDANNNFGVYLESSEAHSYYTQHSFHLNKYYHVTIVGKKSSSGTRFALETYKDGYTVGSQGVVHMYMSVGAIGAGTNDIGWIRSNQDEYSIAGLRFWNRALSESEVKSFNHKLIPCDTDGLTFQTGWGVAQAEWTNTIWSSLGDGKHMQVVGDQVHPSITNITTVKEQKSNVSPWNTTWCNNGQLPAYAYNDTFSFYDESFSAELLFTVPEVLSASQTLVEFGYDKGTDYEAISICLTNQNVERQSYQLCIKNRHEGLDYHPTILENVFYAHDSHQLTFVYKHSTSEVSTLVSIDGQPFGYRNKPFNRHFNRINLGYNRAFPQGGTTPLLIHGFRFWKGYELTDMDVAHNFRRNITASNQYLTCQLGWGKDQGGDYSRWRDTSGNTNDFVFGGYQGISTIETNVGILTPSAFSFQGQLLEDDEKPATMAEREGTAVLVDDAGKEIWSSFPEPLQADSNGLFSLVAQDSGLQTNSLTTALLSSTNTLFLALKVKDTSSHDNPYETVYPNQPLLSVPYALKADYMESAVDLEVSGGLTVRGDAVFDTLEASDIQAQKIIAPKVTASMLSAEAFGFTAEVVRVTAPTVFEHLIVSNNPMHSLLSAAPQRVEMEGFTPDLPKSGSGAKWWKQLNQDGFLNFTVDYYSHAGDGGVDKYIAVCVKQYDLSGTKTPETLYRSWTNGVYDSDLLMIHEARLGDGGISIPVSSGMYIAFLFHDYLSKKLRPLGSQYIRQHYFMTGWFYPLGNQ